MAEFTSKLLDVDVGRADDDVGFLGLMKKSFLLYFWDTDPLETNGVQWRHGAIPVTSPFLQGPEPALNFGAEPRWFCNCKVRQSLLFCDDVL